MKRAVLALDLWIAGCGATVNAPPEPAPAPQEAPAHLPLDAPRGLADAVGQPVRIDARDLVLRLDGAEVHIPYLAGHLVPVAGGQVVDLESPSSFEVTVDALEARIPDQTIQRALLDAPAGNPPFRDLVVRTEGESLLLDGHLRALGLPFTLRADPAVTPGGGLALELEKIRVLGIGVKEFLNALRHPIEQAAKKRGQLITLDAGWLVVNPFPFAGPPEVHAAFTSVEVREHDLVARLGELTPRQERQGPAGVVLRGGVVRSMKVVLFDATLRIVAQDGGALVIDPDTFADQIAGGVVKSTQDGDVTVYVLAPGAPPLDPVEPPPGGPAEAKTPPEPEERTKRKP